jgi:hypothetical protein
MPRQRATEHPEQRHREDTPQKPVSAARFDRRHEDRFGFLPLQAHCPAE